MTTISPFPNPVSILFSILRKLIIEELIGIDLIDGWLVSFELFRFTIFKHFSNVGPQYKSQ